MNVNYTTRFLQYNLMSRFFSNTTGNSTVFSNSVDKMSEKYRNRYASTNEVKVNSQGLTGMLFNFDSTDTSGHRQIIGISDEGKQKIFDMVKSEFMKENGVHNGDTTHRTEVYAEYLRSIPACDRAKASWTLDRLEAEYWQGFADAAKQADSAWEPGKPFDYNVIQGITREDVSGKIDKQSGTGINIRV